MPRHDHPGVEPSGERDAHSLSSLEVARKVASKDLAQLLIVGLRFKGWLLLPLLWFEVRALSYDRPTPESPRGGRRQHLDVLEKRAASQRATTGNDLRQAIGINRSQLRTHRKNRLGLGGKIECVGGLMKIDSLHPVAIIEKTGRPLAGVNQHPLKPPIQAARKLGIFLGKMHQVFGTVGVQRVTPLPQQIHGVRFPIVFAREKEHQVATLVNQRHFLRVRSTSRHPAHIEAEGFVRPGAANIRLLVTK